MILKLIALVIVLAVAGFVAGGLVLLSGARLLGGLFKSDKAANGTMAGLGALLMGTGMGALYRWIRNHRAGNATQVL